TSLIFSVVDTLLQLKLLNKTDNHLHFSTHTCTDNPFALDIKFSKSNEYKITGKMSANQIFLSDSNSIVNNLFKEK
ncbi:MAG: hypothetical protein ACI837_003570, partial [Crocinitomicaceae bacterium]